MTKPNLLVLGASGGVARAFLLLLAEKRHLLNALILLDKKEDCLSSPVLDHKKLDYIFIKKEILFSSDDSSYHDILSKYQVSAVLDLTDLDTLPILESTNRAGVAYLNTAMNGVGVTTDKLITSITERRGEIAGASHILCAGMNPGNVNIWVQNGIRKFGDPEKIIHFEFDTSMTSGEWRPLVTWSRAKFLAEAVYDPGGVALGRGRFKKILPNAIENLVDMEPMLSPILKLESYPSGLPILHEENITIANRHDLPSEFIYSIHLKTMEFLQKTYREKGTIVPDDLILADNASMPLEGQDLIGVVLSYPDKDVYYYNALENKSVRGTNATYHQVAVGVMAALLTWLDGLEAGVYFTGELYDTIYTKYLFNNLKIEEKIFTKS